MGSKSEFNRPLDDAQAGGRGAARAARLASAMRSNRPEINGKFDAVGVLREIRKERS